MLNLLKHRLISPVLGVRIRPDGSALLTCPPIGNLSLPSKFGRIAMDNRFEISPGAIFVTDADGDNG
jgi:hypothetical protein